LALARSIRPASVLGLTNQPSILSMTVRENVVSYFEQLRAPVFRFLLPRTRDASRADDLTQESFLGLHRHLQEGRELDNPTACLFTVANHMAIDATRRSTA
jgi:DNA-directed RNA polymerase specialized sigma24 family protein